MRKTLCKLWTNFAKYQDPTPEYDNPLPLKWKPLQPLNENIKELDLSYLIINDKPKMVQNINQVRMDFWRKLYGKWNNSFTTPKL